MGSLPLSAALLTGLLSACQDAEDTAMAFALASGTRGYSCSPRYRYLLNADSNFPDRCLFTAPDEDDMSLYETSAIRAAWEAGDPSGLPKEDRQIYDQAEKVLKKS